MGSFYREGEEGVKRRNPLGLEKPQGGFDTILQNRYSISVLNR